MKNKFIILLLAILAFSSSLTQLQAQEYHEFAPIGAKWWYDVDWCPHNPPTCGYLFVESIKDTFIKNTPCKVLQKTLYDEHGTSNILGYDYLYNDKDKVYHFDGNDFYALYDFSIENDEIINVREGNFSGYTWYENDVFTNFGAKIDSVSTIEINGKKLRTIYYEPYSLADWEWSFDFNSPTFEVIGHTAQMFGRTSSYVLGGYYGSLRCYEDKEIKYYSPHIQWYEGGCSFIDGLVDIPKYRIEKKLINIYPVPSENIIHLSFQEEAYPKNLTLIIYDSLGRILKKEFLDHLKDVYDIYIGNLINGLYFLELKNNEFFIKEVFYKK